MSIAIFSSALGLEMMQVAAGVDLATEAKQRAAGRNYVVMAKADVPLGFNLFFRACYLDLATKKVVVSFPNAVKVAHDVRRTRRALVLTDLDKQALNPTIRKAVAAEKVKVLAADALLQKKLGTAKTVAALYKLLNGVV